MKNKFLDIIRQRFTFPEDIPSAVEEDVSHPSVVGDGKREVLPIYWFIITEDAIDDTKSGFQVRIFLVVLGAHDRVSARDGLEHRLVRLVADTFTLNREMEEGLGAEISLVSELGNHHRTSA